MDHLTNYRKNQPWAEARLVDANEDAFADNEEVEEDDVDKFLKGQEQAAKDLKTG